MQILTDPQPTAIGTLFQSVTTVVTEILKLMTSVASTLMNNSIFQITIGIVILGIIMSLIFTLVRKMKRRGR